MTWLTADDREYPSTAPTSTMPTAVTAILGIQPKSLPTYEWYPQKNAERFISGVFARPDEALGRGLCRPVADSVLDLLPQRHDLTRVEDRGIGARDDPDEQREGEIAHRKASEEEQGEQREHDGQRRDHGTRERLH